MHDSRRFLSLLLAAAHLTALLLAFAPDLHRRVHDEADGHACAVTAALAGTLDGAEPSAPRLVAPVAVGAALFFEGEAQPSGCRIAAPDGRAPPAC